MNDRDLRRQHLRHVLAALIEYHNLGGELRLRSEDGTAGSLRVTIEVDDPALLNAQVTEMIARDPQAKRPPE